MEAKAYIKFLRVSLALEQLLAYAPERKPADYL